MNQLFRYFLIRLDMYLMDIVLMEQENYREYKFFKKTISMTIYEGKPEVKTYFYIVVYFYFD